MVRSTYGTSEHAPTMGLKKLKISSLHNMQNPWRLNFILRSQNFWLHSRLVEDK